MGNPLGVYGTNYKVKKVKNLLLGKIWHPSELLFLEWSYCTINEAKRIGFEKSKVAPSMDRLVHFCLFYPVFFFDSNQATLTRMLIFEALQCRQWASAPGASRKALTTLKKMCSVGVEAGANFGKKEESCSPDIVVLFCSLMWKQLQRNPQDW